MEAFLLFLAIIVLLMGNKEETIIVNTHQVIISIDIAVTIIITIDTE